jgi:hypothetical protein
VIFATLPPQHTVLVVSNKTYYFHDDVYLIRVVDRGVVSYQVIQPPYGASVRILPVGYRTVVVRGSNYFVHDDIYYIQRGNDYVVVVRP